MTTLPRFALCATLALSAVSAFANDPAATPRIDQRQANQERRIDQGVASGELNARETRRLERQQNRIERAETQAKSDGVVTKQERAGLHHMQDRASHNIRHQKHDRQVAR
jgi:hypothetical protein